MTPTLGFLNENTVASLLVAGLAIAGVGHGTVAIVTIGLIHMVNLPALLEVICKEAREGC